MADHFDIDAVRDHYDRISVFYRALWGDHIHHGYWEHNESPEEAQVKLIEKLAEHARIRRGARVLDVGCGVGGSSLWLARHLDCMVTGVTISPVQASMAAEQARREGLADLVRFEVGDANQLKVPHESFDVIWVIECSEHLADKRSFIRSCAQALKPGGVLALCAWLVTEQNSDKDAQLVARVCEGMLCPSLASLEDYSNWMRESGFEEIEARNITRNVARTWTRCATLLHRPEIKTLIRVSDERTRRFAAAFEAIDEAYTTGAMAYGLFTARKN